MARTRDRDTGRTPLHWSTAALLALAVFVPTAHADTTAPLDAHTRQQFTETAPGARTGWTIDAATRPPFARAVAPPQRRVEIVFPRGTRLDTGAVRPCRASDLALLVDGSRACPRRSRVGSGSATLYVGPGMTTNVDVGVYAAPGALVLLYGGEPHTVVLNLARGKVIRNRVVFAAPVMRRLSGLKASITRLRLRLAAAGDSGRALIRAPRTCPPGGRWTFAYLSHYDWPFGVQRSTSSTPCR
jgi:hypothetical protein